MFDEAKKAYYRDRTFTAWCVGNNVHIALCKFFNNFNAKNKSQIDFNWVNYKDPVEKLFKPKTISKEDMEIEFRKRQAQDWEFVQKILHRS